MRLIADAIPARITYSDTQRAPCCSATGDSPNSGAPTRKRSSGRRVGDVVSPAAYDADRPRARSQLPGEARRFDLVVDRAEGAHYYQVDHVPDVDAHGNVHGVVTISQDVTALRQAKQALIASEKRMRMVADNLPALIAYLSADERYLFVNARSRQMFGLAPEQLVGRKVSELLAPDTYAQTAPHIERVRKGERARFQRDVDAQRPRDAASWWS